MSITMSALPLDPSVRPVCNHIAGPCSPTRAPTLCSRYPIQRGSSSGVRPLPDLVVTFAQPSDVRVRGSIACLELHVSSPFGTVLLLRYRAAVGRGSTSTLHQRGWAGGLRTIGWQKSGYYRDYSSACSPQKSGHRAAQPLFKKLCGSW